MAEESWRKRMQEEATCSICLDYFRDPVSLDCGHNFCQACITQCWGDLPRDVTCPQCRERVQSSNLRLNRHLANMVGLIKEMGEPPNLEATGWTVCKRHQEPLKLFCQDDGTLICVVCDRSKEHRAHQVVPLEEAAQEFKDQISHSLEILKKERENILRFKAENEKESQELLKQMEAEKEKTAAAFRDLHQFLEEQEKLLLTQMEEVEKEIARRRDEHLASLSAELSSLDSLILELEEKQQQSANELLQNIVNVLERCRKDSFKNPVAFPVALQLKIHDFCDVRPFLEGIMKQFQESLKSGLLLQEANVTLDPDTAHPQLILSEDRKSVRWEDKRQALPNNPERFDTRSFVLGNERMTSGRHFWEVAVGSEEAWSVGVARNDVKRKGKFDVRPSEGIWDLGMWKGTYRISNHPRNTPLPLAQKPKKIRVTLNCTGGRVAFFDADTGTHLHTHSNASLPGETLLPFFYVWGGGTLTLCL